ncbi:hypothetical protein [Streptomyces lancefieldiae]|uniref:WXG100 family type VII secretion target n=1 Tax=Streptomyces lancefieldiae TaxID=3075520 RepID=A0ABU3AUR5_9ACTN|nr:hypothetical protein [Streptomyces sp. DSM 40712]MDT0613899.1 hypothetical protein [Streptomyces sp. DSM 40712]
MISPAGIPQFTGDFDQLDKDVSSLRSDAIGIRDGGSDVHSRFQMLEAFYTAPEAETLFATTQPVMDKADTFAAKLETVADALDTFAIEARPLAKRLEQLKADAIAFVNSVDGDDVWTEDEDKVDQNRQLLDDVTAAQFAFQESERRAATKISAIVGGPKFVADNGSGLIRFDTVRYGYEADLLEEAEDLPWGTPEDQTYEAWSLGWFGHGAKSLFWDGIYKDGIEAGAKGLWDLVTGDSEAWSGLKDVVTGIGLYTMTPYDAFMDWAVGPDEESADEARAKKATKEFGKALVAWDMWQENPARATGTVVFNALTLGAGPLATASKASKGGTAGKAAGVAAKAGMFMDPVYVGLRASSTAVGKLPKISELTSRTTGVTGATADVQRVHSVIELDDGSKVVLENGEFVPYDKHGEAISDTPKQERYAAAEPAPEQVAPRREQELAGVGAMSRTSDATAHAGDTLPPGAGRDTHTSPSGAGMPRGSTGEAVSSVGAGHAVGSHVPGSGGGTTSDGHMGNGSGSRGNGGPDDLGRPGGEASGAGIDGAADAAGSGLPRQYTDSQRPSFMGNGPNPYGPRGSLTLEQIEEIQVYRANHEPGYRKQYYRKNGTRLDVELHDESGHTPPQLTQVPDNGLWIRAKDAPEPPKPHYIDAEYIRVGADTVTSAERLRVLQEAAWERHAAVQYDNLVADWKAQTGAAHGMHGTVDTAAQWGEAKGAYKESHTAMRDATEAFGEKAAEYHYIAENHPDFKKQTLLGPRNGNDQFDQVWKHEDGRIVVIEAKSSPDTELGRRTLPGGRQVSQGSKEYFYDILAAMEKRGEYDLVEDMEKAIGGGKLDYVVIRGERNAGTYTGYRYRRFDISRGTLP